MTTRRLTRLLLRRTRDLCSDKCSRVCSLLLHRVTKLVETRPTLSDGLYAPPQLVDHIWEHLTHIWNLPQSTHRGEGERWEVRGGGWEVGGRRQEVGGRRWEVGRHACIHPCMHTPTHAYTHACIHHACTCIHPICTCICTCTSHACMQVGSASHAVRVHTWCMCMYACMHVCMYACACACACVHVQVGSAPYAVRVPLPKLPNGRDRVRQLLCSR